MSRRQGVRAVLLLVVAALVCCLRRRRARRRGTGASSKSPVAQSAQSASDAGRSPFLARRSGAELLPPQRTSSDHAANPNSTPFKRLDPPASAAGMSGSLPTVGSCQPMHAQEGIAPIDAMHGSARSSADTPSLQARSKGKNPDTVVSFNTTSNERSVELTGAGEGGAAQVPESPYAKGALHSTYRHPSGHMLPLLQTAI